MFTGNKNENLVISFPDLPPAEASILAKELAQEIALRTGNQVDIKRASDDAQDLGSLLLIAAGSGLGAGLLELAKDAAKGVVVGVANRVGQKVFDAIWPILRKWGTRAKVETPAGEAVTLGDEFSRPVAPRSAADAKTLADLKTLGVVILGASTFPHYPTSLELNNEAFKRSAELAKKVLSREHTVFRDVKVLDLFDQELSPLEILDCIERHVKKHPDMGDLVLYYCGHGDLLGDHREKNYYLLLKGTKPENEEFTGLGVKQFRTVARRRGLLRRRCIFILDCCFAGEAVSAMQATGLNTLIEKQLGDLPSQGLALLTASDKDLPAIGKGGYKDATMFTGALAEVLEGKASGFRQLSLRHLCEAVEERIKHRHDLKAVVPQCHVPLQVEGDISRIPMFLAGSPGLARPSIELSPQAIKATELTKRPGFFPWLFSLREGQRANPEMPPITQVTPPPPPPDPTQEWAKLEASKDNYFPGNYAEPALERVASLEKDAADPASEKSQHARTKNYVGSERRADSAPYSLLVPGTMTGGGGE